MTKQRRAELDAYTPQFEQDLKNLMPKSEYEKVLAADEAGEDIPWEKYNLATWSEKLEKSQTPDYIEYWRNIPAMSYERLLQEYKEHCWWQSLGPEEWRRRIKIEDEKEKRAERKRKLAERDE